jgi:hypothetical protein
MTRNIRWTDFRYEPIAGIYDVGICTTSVGCKRGISRLRHQKGYADRLGTIHWNRWVSSPTRKRGLHKLLTLIAIVKMQQWRRDPLPKWKALHEQETWASKEGIKQFHVKFPRSYSQAARDAAWKDAQTLNAPTRTVDMAAYQWMHSSKED